MEDSDNKKGAEAADALAREAAVHIQTLSLTALQRRFIVGDAEVPIELISLERGRSTVKSGLAKIEASAKLLSAMNSEGESVCLPLIPF